MLTLHVERTLIHRARHIHECTGGGGGHTVLSGSSFGNDALLAHLLGKENLTERIVDFVGTRVVEVFALQIELAAVLLAHALGIVEWGRTTHIVLQQGVVLAFELLALQDGEVGFLQVLHRLVENLWDVGSAELSVEAVLIYLISRHVYCRFYDFIVCLLSYFAMKHIV